MGRTPVSCNPNAICAYTEWEPGCAALVYVALYPFIAATIALITSVLLSISSLLRFNVRW
jgi:hypothetical protein